MRTATHVIVLEEFPLNGRHEEVTVRLSGACHQREYAAVEGVGRVCTFGGAVADLEAELLSVRDASHEWRPPMASEAAAFADDFWAWLTADRERWLTDELFSQEPTT